METNITTDTLDGGFVKVHGNRVKVQQCEKSK